VGFETELILDIYLLPQHLFPAAGAFNVKKPCTKLLHFTFSNNSFDSDSCYNFAKGEPYGEPSLVNNLLCLNGVDQFLQVTLISSL